MSEMDNSKNIGIITSRKCPTCGHHEIGYTSSDGEFHPLKQGEMIQILEPAYYPQMQEITETSYKDLQSNIQEKQPDFEVWVPEVFRVGKRSLSQNLSRKGLVRKS